MGARERLLLEQTRSVFTWLYLEIRSDDLLTCFALGRKAKSQLHAPVFHSDTKCSR